MKIFKLLMTAISVACFFSCGSDSKSQKNDAGTEADSRDTVNIIYSSHEAASLPPYDSDKSYDCPLSLIETLNTTVTPVNIDDVGAYQSGGRMEYGITLINMTADTIHIESLKLPDDRFEARWNGPSRYIPRLYTGFRLTADSAESIKDYRFIITYKGNRYPQQAFHINLHPDVNILKEIHKN